MDPLQEVPDDCSTFRRQHGRVVLFSQVERDGATVGKWLLENVAGQGGNLAFGIHPEKVILLQSLVLAVVDEAKRDRSGRPRVMRRRAELDGVAGHHRVEGEGGGIERVLRIAQSSHLVLVDDEVQRGQGNQQRIDCIEL